MTVLLIHALALSVGSLLRLASLPAGQAFPFAAFLGLGVGDGYLFAAPRTSDRLALAP